MIMKVRAKYQFSYKGISYKGGQEFVVAKDDYEAIKNDVVEVTVKKAVKRAVRKAASKTRNKQIKSSKNK